MQNYELLLKSGWRKIIVKTQKRPSYGICTPSLLLPTPSLSYSKTLLKYFLIKSVDTESRAGLMIDRIPGRVKLLWAREYTFAYPQTHSIGLSSQWNFGRNTHLWPLSNIYLSTSVFSLWKSVWKESTIRMSSAFIRSVLIAPPMSASSLLARLYRLPVSVLALPTLYLTCMAAFLLGAHSSWWC